MQFNPSMVVKEEISMSETNFRKLTGIFFIVGAILVNIPCTLLIMAFAILLSSHAPGARARAR